MFSFLSKHWATLLTVLFLAYIGYSFYQISLVVNPAIPPITAEDGTLLPHYQPLWSEASHMELSVALSPASVLKKKDVPRVILLEIGKGQGPWSSSALAKRMQYAFNSTLELDMALNLLRDVYVQQDEGSEVVNYVAEDEAHGGEHDERSHTGAARGFHLYCTPTSAAKDMDSDICFLLHQALSNTSSRPQASRPAIPATAPLGAAVSNFVGSLFHPEQKESLSLGVYVMPGFQVLPPRHRHLHHSWVGARANQGRHVPSLSVYNHTTADVGFIVNSMTTGAPLYAHVSISVPMLDTKSVTSSSSSSSSSSSFPATAFKLHEATSLIVPRNFEAPRLERYLWEDPSGDIAQKRLKENIPKTTLAAESVARTLLVPIAAANEQQRLDASNRPGGGAASPNGGLNRLYLHTTTCRGAACSTAQASSPPDGSSSEAVTHSIPSPGLFWPHWVGYLGAHFIMETLPLPRDTLPAQLRPYMNLVSSDVTAVAAASDFDGGSETAPRNVADSKKTKKTKQLVGKYLPLLAVNPVRPTGDRFHPLNHTITSLPLRFVFSPVSIGQWQLLQLLDHSLSTQQSMGANEKDTDEIVRLFADTPMWLLGLTMLVSCVHLAFDLLALKSDISFWSATKSFKGISVRSLAIQFVSQLIISAYLWNEKSSLLVLVPQCIFTILILWKMARASGIELKVVRVLWVLPCPQVTFDQQLRDSVEEDGSNAYDRQAVSALLTLLFPIAVGFVAHAFVYQKHASFLHWALSSAVGAVYTFGFILMTPQLWINYKMKSVAQLPWNVLAYRFFNTVIDDLFASIIRMPLMHRISVFRDDVIFIIYLCQRWMYPVDAGRPAETFDEEESHSAQTTSALEREKENEKGRVGK